MKGKPEAFAISIHWFNVLRKFNFNDISRQKVRLRFFFTFVQYKRGWIQFIVYFLTLGMDTKFICIFKGQVALHV